MSSYFLFGEVGTRNGRFCFHYFISLLSLMHQFSNLNSPGTSQISFFIDSFQVYDYIFLVLLYPLGFFSCTCFCGGMSRTQAEVVLSIYTMAFW